MGDKQAALDRLKQQIAESDTLTDRDRENLLTFDDRMALLRSDYSVSRREKHLRACTIMAGQAQRDSQDDLPDTELSAALDSRDAAEELVRWIHEYRSDSEETNKDYRLALRAFGKHVTDGDDIPDTISWVSATYSNSYNPTPSPSEMLDWDEDVVPMIDDPKTNPRNAALIAVAWDSGARAGELLSTTVGDVADTSNGVYLTVDGKTGERSILLADSLPYLNGWLDAHPYDHDRTAPLWCKMDESEPVTEQYVWQMLRRTAKRAGVTKTVNLTKFRKSRASDLASRGMNQAYLEDRFGWVTGSPIAARYISVFSNVAEEQFRELHGMAVEDETTAPTGPVPCPRCDADVPRHKDRCGGCRYPLSKDAIVEAEQAQNREVVAAGSNVPAKEEDYLNWLFDTILSGTPEERVRLAKMFGHKVPGDWDIEPASATDSGTGTASE
jgi:integrase